MTVAMRKGLEEEEAILEMELGMGMEMWVGLSWGVERCCVFLREEERLRAVDFSGGGCCGELFVGGGRSIGG